MDWKSKPTTGALFQSSSGFSQSGGSSMSAAKGAKPSESLSRQGINFGRGTSFLPSVESPSSSRDVTTASHQALMGALNKWRISNGLDAPQGTRRSSVSGFQSAPASPSPLPSSPQNRAAKIENAFKTILVKPPQLRTPDDVQLLVEITRALYAFEGLERDKHIEICRLMRLEKHPANSLVFNQGDEAKCWYVVKRGSVSVHCSGLGGTHDQAAQKVAVLHRGDG
eukprot:TRINITY_DN14750_c0_g1_i1.p1 TRINITY_DN14750_c0_g1~~TRINITY_DN14750_c0_g1_i1.p1  ORF type:complete len:225 (+),score=43.86 TRINITY_DN14750_c0_g1_i1:173-847(+)